MGLENQSTIWNRGMPAIQGLLKYGDRGSWNFDTCKHLQVSVNRGSTVAVPFVSIDYMLFVN